MTREKALKIWESLACGCGQPERVLEWLHGALQLIAARSAASFDRASNAALAAHWPTEETPAYWIAWYWLDNATPQLIEHGHGVAGSWLTPDGVDFLAFLDAGGATYLEDPLELNRGDE